MILDEIVKKRRLRYEEIKKKKPLENLVGAIQDMPIPRQDFYQLFNRKKFIYICECKKASPSKGIICKDYRPAEIAKEYEKNGADCISCLTEPDYFLGSNFDLQAVRQAVKIPILRKDFIVDSYQIYETRLLGADAVLLICSILTDTELKEYIELTHALGLGCLVETHNEEEIHKAIRCNAKVIGVNNRNLKDFTMDTSLSLRLRAAFPETILISESGVREKEDVVRLKQAGLNGVLMGEVLMKSDCPGKKLKELRDES